MKIKYSPFYIPPRWQWMVKPALITGAGGTALAPFLEESAIVAADLLPLAALPGMAGIIFWFNHRVFRSSFPEQKPVQKPDVDRVINRNGKSRLRR